MITIEDSTLAHVRELGPSIKEADGLEAQRLGLEPHRALFHSMRTALYRKTGLIDGSVACMWGVCGVPLGRIGYPYLVTNNLLYKIPPIKFARIYKKEVEVMKTLFPVLKNYVDAQYPESIRMLGLAGFSISDEEDIVNGHPFKVFYLIQPEN